MAQFDDEPEYVELRVIDSDLTTEEDESIEKATAWQRWAQAKLDDLKVTAESERRQLHDRINNLTDELREQKKKAEAAEQATKGMEAYCERVRKETKHVLAVGSAVRFASCTDLIGKVHAVVIEAETTSYEVVWWVGHTRHMELVEISEIVPEETEKHNLAPVIFNTPDQLVPHYGG